MFSYYMLKQISAGYFFKYTKIRFIFTNVLSKNINPVTHPPLNTCKLFLKGHDMDHATLTFRSESSSAGSKTT